MDCCIIAVETLLRLFGGLGGVFEKTGSQRGLDILFCVGFRCFAVDVTGQSGQVAPSRVPENGSNRASFQGKPLGRIVFYGPEHEAKALESLLARLDTPEPQVEIRAGIYEYQTDISKGSAVKAVLNLFNGKLAISFGAAAAGDTIKIKAPSIDAVLALLDQDGRFKNVAQPRVMGKDGEPARFFAGQKERVSGSLVLDRNGNPIQSKESLEAGITLEVTPRIRRDSVDVLLHESVSTFIASSSGSSDPAMLTRDISSRLSMKPGYVYVVGGLKSERKTGDASRFLGLPLGSSEHTQETELVLLMSVSPDAEHFDL